MNRNQGRAHGKRRTNAYGWEKDKAENLPYAYIMNKRTTKGVHKITTFQCTPTCKSYFFSGIDFWNKIPN